MKAEKFSKGIEYHVVLTKAEINIIAALLLHGEESLSFFTSRGDRVLCLQMRQILTQVQVIDPSDMPKWYQQIDS